MEKDNTNKLRELGLTDEQIEAVQTLYENQKKFIVSDEPITDFGEPEIPVPIKALDLTHPKSLDLARIQEVYDEICLELAFDQSGENPRDVIKKLLENEFPHYVIKCDDENNSPEVTENGEIWARIQTPDGFMGSYNYVDLVF